MEIYLPPTLDITGALKVIQDVVNIDWTPKEQNIQFYFSDIKWVEPTGVTAFCNLIRWLQYHGVYTYFMESKRLRTECRPSIKYLDDAGFFNYFTSESLFKNSTCRQTTIPLMEIKLTNYIRWAQEKVIPWLDGRLDLRIEDQMPEFKTCLDEIFNNIEDHSGMDNGCSFAQHFPTKEKVVLSVSDFGVGIPYHVRGKYPDLSPKDAILVATEEGFSTKEQPAYRGSGLDTLIQNIVGSNHGRVEIYSWNGEVFCVSKNGAVHKEGRQLSATYPGTLIELTLSTKSLMNAESISGAFSWVL